VRLGAVPITGAFGGGKGARVPECRFIRHSLRRMFQVQSAAKPTRVVVRSLLGHARWILVG
jgi:hypothetical protein